MSDSVLSGGVIFLSKFYCMNTRIVFSNIELKSKIFCILGIDFALFCINNNILPSIQFWLRKLPAHVVLDANDSTTFLNFKQCCGTLTDLIVFYFIHLSGNYCISSVLVKKVQLNQ